jgi:hypothetical protein
MLAREFNAALETAEQITRIQIDITGPDGFRWTLFDGNRLVYAGDGDRREIDALITSTELLLKSGASARRSKAAGSTIFGIELRTDRDPPATAENPPEPTGVKHRPDPSERVRRDPAHAILTN